MRVSTLITTSLMFGGEALARRSLQHVGKRGKDSTWNRVLDRRQIPEQPVKRADNSTDKFLAEKTKEYAVDGTAIPDVDWDVGESYAGQMPIGEANPDSNLFFWFFPSENEEAEKEILIWLNGGPGCSSLEGFLQENGPFLWQYGTYKPIENPWSWHKLTNMVWVEQPVGTGFSQGTVTATNEEEVAEQFMGFWKNFVDTFDLAGYSVYIAGESYAGLYCPYIASGMVDADDADYFDMKGLLIYDPVVNEDAMTEQIPTVAFTDYWAGLFPFNDTYKEYIHTKADECGYTEFMETYLQYPPPGPMPAKLPGTVENTTSQTSAECDLFDSVIEAELLLNPCWDIYQVATTCPLLWDVLGFPGTFEYLPEGAEIYFNRSDVKDAIHAPQDVDWALCTPGDVFVDGEDNSEPSSVYALPNVIEHTNNVVISHGALDMVLLANGTLLAIQNMTWGGMQGFQSKPVEPFFVPYHTISPFGDGPMSAWAASGVFGTSHTERGLTYVGVDMAGHMVPQYAPSAAYRQIEFLLGRVESMEENEPFTFETNISQPDEEEFGLGTAPAGWSDVGSNTAEDGEDGGSGGDQESSASSSRLGRRNSRLFGNWGRGWY
ncbi:hypothetical protein MKZ38_004862 [Zalerion maritima]|uniref:Carboxypeptidase n=1 Tax=Zalerion maritima TaxID=339359 RepID=A0AAD5RKY8_9PEZI|nr:hypothetical protein MKZ38_004862 [Zalerion maritima]